MTDNLEADIDRSLSHEERAVVALEKIAVALTAWVRIEAKRVEHEYPEKREPRDATVTRIPTEEDKLKASIFGTESTTREWLEPGTFEKRFNDRPKQDPKRTDKAEKTGSTPAPEGDGSTS